MRASFLKTGETLLAWQANQEPAGMDLRCKEATDSIEFLGLKLVVGGFSWDCLRTSDYTGSAWLELCLFGYCGTNTSFLKLGVCSKSISKRAYLLKAVLEQT